MKNRIFAELYCDGAVFAFVSRANRQRRKPMPMKFSGILLLACLAIFVTAQTRADEHDSQQRVFSFGIVPQQSASRLAHEWGPLLRHLSDKTGVKLEFKTAPSINEFETRFGNGDYDFVYMNPYHYVVASESPGYRAFARVANKQIRGVLVVRKDSGITSLKQLSGNTLAFPSPAAFAASLLTRAELSDREIDFTARYVNSHDSVYRTVAKGLFPAGGGIVRTFNLVDPSVRNELTILWTTPGYTPHAFAVHPDVSAEIAQRISQSMIELSADEQGAALLNKLGMKSLAPAEDSDWNDVRQLSLERLLVQE